MTSQDTMSTSGTARPLTAPVTHGENAVFDAPAAMRLAVETYQRGEWDLTEECCRRILAVDPGCADALILLGVIAAQTNHLPEAESLLQRAVAANPEDANAHSNLGASLNGLCRFDAALASFDQAIRISPTSAGIWHNRAIALRGLRRFDEALQCIDRALSINPQFAEAHNNRGMVLCETGNFENAKACFEKALAIAPDYAEAFFNRANLLLDARRFDEALIDYDRALSVNSNFADAFNNRGTVLCELGRFEEALDSYARALQINPGDHEVHNNRAVALQELHRFDAALESYGQALVIQPDHADTHFNIGQCLLSIGQFETGWPEYEWRWRSNAAQVSRGLARHQSIGAIGDDDRAAGALLIWGEAGIGDRILFGTMLNGASELSEGVIVETDERMLPLLRRAYPGMEFVPPMETEELRFRYPRIRRQIALGDLGGLLRRSPEAFSTRSSYLKADAARVEQIRQLNGLNAGERVIGLSWRSRNPEIGADKSLALLDFLPLIETMEEAVFVSLQYGDVEEESAAFTAKTGRRIRLLDGVDLYGSMEDLAAAISLCNNVVTCSNVTAHMACALGVGTKVLLPWSKGCLWYWGATGDRTLWYPTARLFRQQSAGNWRGAIEHAGEDLAG